MISKENDPGWSLRIRRLAICTVLVFTVLSVWLRLTSVKGLDRFGNPLAPDLGQFYVAGQMAQSGQLDRIYDVPYVWARINDTLGLPRDGAGYPFLYPPFVPWFCVPLGWLPYSLTATLYILASALLAVALGWWIAARLMPDRERAVDAFWLFIASLPVIRCVLYGQTGILSLILFCFFYLAWKKERPWLAGFILALGAFKPQLFLGLYVWLGLFGSNRARAGLLTGLALLFGIGCGGGFNLTLWMEWLRVVSQTQDSATTYLQMHSWRNAFFPWAPLPLWLLLVRNAGWGMLLAAWGVGLVQLRRGGMDKEFALAFALLGWLLLTPRFCQYDALILYPVIILWWLADEKRGGKDRVWIAAAVGGFYLNDLAMRLSIPLVTILGVALFVRMCRVIVHERRNSQIRV